jgi:hypothetical protein
LRRVVDLIGAIDPDTRTVAARFGAGIHLLHQQ